METLLARIEESGHGNYDPEILEILRSSFGSETTLARASCARLVAELMKEWGMIVLDPHSPGPRKRQDALRRFPDALPASSLQCSLLPVIATVIDPFEVESFAGAQSFFERAEPCRTQWRGRRPARRSSIAGAGGFWIGYGLDLKRLYAGADAIIGRNSGCNASRRLGKAR